LQFPPGPKLGGMSRAIARRACEYAHTGSVILASEGVSQQFPTLVGCGAPVLAGERWIATSREDLEDRTRLSRYMTGEVDVPRTRSRWFLRALERYRVNVVVLNRNAVRMPRLKALLLLAGFEKVDEVEWDIVLAPASFETIDNDRRAAEAACRLAPKHSLVLAPFGVSREVETLGCAQPVVRIAGGEDAMTAQEDLLLQLERAVHVDVKPKLSVQELALVDHWLAEPHLSVVVVTRQALGNRQLKASLRAHGFQRAVAMKTHQVYRRLRAEGLSPDGSGR